MKLEELSADREKILSFYKKTQNDITVDLKILKEWMKKQSHIPSQSIEDSFLEIQLINNKFSLEKVKSKLENYCTLKGLPRYACFYENIPKPSQSNVFYVPMPTLTPDGKRVIVSKMKNNNDYDILEDISCNVFILEFLSRFDYNDGLIFIFDHSKATASVMSKFRINLVADSVTLGLDGFSARIKELHLVNKIAAFFCSALKPLLPHKLMSRFSFHNDLESLENVVSPKCLPKDFGGELKSYDEFLADWDIIFEEQGNLLKKFIHVKAIEELRVSPSKIDGMQGTFKKLNID